MTILATIIVLGVLIFIHELGHFLAAKAMGIGVERFSIGLGPGLFGFTRGETEYVISAIPLGGYVKMQGMNDELMEAIEGGRAPEADARDRSKDYDSKPVLARAFVISAGVLMNFAFAFGVYASIVGVWGYQEQNTTRVGDVRGELLPAGTEALAGVPIGSEITRIGSETTEDWGDVRDGLYEAPTGALEVETRNPARTFEIRVPAEREARARLAGALTWWVEPRVGLVTPGSPADRARLESDDLIVAVESREIDTWSELVAAIRARPDVETAITLERNGARLTRTVTPQATEEVDPITGERVTVGTIGVGLAIDPDAVVYERASPGEAIVFGYRETVAVSGQILGFLGGLFTGDVSPRSMGSIVTIGSASGQAAELGIQAFLRFMALFSVNLAILNLLPIPVLDGGHLVFLGLEAARGRAVSTEQRIRWTNLGFMVLMGIMVFALGNDLLRLVGL
ncbi:MAG: RIP metalloprotease RseP [Longimicrobiales bacterium]|nr:RIP metalloprotease RseP [Longimicrobiales bacterium]